MTSTRTEDLIDAEIRVNFFHFLLKIKHKIYSMTKFYLFIFFNLISNKSLESISLLKKLCFYLPS